MDSEGEETQFLLLQLLEKLTTTVLLLLLRFSTISRRKRDVECSKDFGIPCMANHDEKYLTVLVMGFK